jgi:putative transposase
MGVTPLDDPFGVNKIRRSGSNRVKDHLTQEEFMPRSPRLLIDGAIYHVVSRGVKQTQIFLEDPDRFDFLRLLKLTRDEQPFILHDYCLMSNHYHLLIQPLDASLSRIMHTVNSVYGNRFNKRHALTGHVLQGRFHSIPVETDAYLATVSRYIHLNPVVAGIVKRPEDYRWSNYRVTVEGLADSLADPSFILGYFGKDVGRQRLAYKQFVEEGMNLPQPLTDRVLWRMRQWGNPLRGHTHSAKIISRLGHTDTQLDDLSQIPQ